MRLPYNQLNALLVNSYKPIYPHFEIGTDITVSLGDYIKSQIHFNVVSDLFNRDLSLYLKSLDFIEGNSKYLLEFTSVLRYFYTDMFNALLKNYVEYGKEIGVSIICDIDIPDILPLERISISEILEELSTGNYRILTKETLSKFDKDLISKGQGSVTLAKSILLYQFSVKDDITFLEMR